MQFLEKLVLLINSIGVLSPSEVSNSFLCHNIVVNGAIHQVKKKLTIFRFFFGFFGLFCSDFSFFVFRVRENFSPSSGANAKSHGPAVHRNLLDRLDLLVSLVLLASMG